MTMFKRGRNSVGWREQGRKRGGIKIEPRELKRWGEADGLRTVANFGNYCDSHADFERVFDLDELATLNFKLPDCIKVQIITLLIFGAKFYFLLNDSKNIPLDVTVE